VVLLPARDIPFDTGTYNIPNMDCAAQWVNNVSVITANAQLASCSIRSHPYDVDVNSRALVSPRHPLSSQNSTRGLTPEGSESPEPFDSYSGPSDEHEASLETGPEELDDPWPYTFRVGDSVWIRTEGGKWYPGKVSSNNIKRGQTRQVSNFT